MKRGDRVPAIPDVQEALGPIEDDDATEERGRWRNRGYLVGVSAPKRSTAGSGISGAKRPAGWRIKEGPEE